MVLIDQHSQEIFWLQRRIRFLQELDKLLEQDSSPKEVKPLEKQFSKVENPADVIDRLKDVYGRKLR